MRIVNKTEMKAIEDLTINEFGFEESLIIENVGASIATYIFEDVLSFKDFGEILIFLGRGNNAADGLAIGRHLVNLGVNVRAFFLFPEEDLSEQAKKQRLLASKFGVKCADIQSIEELRAYFDQAGDEYFIIDAICGTGYRGPLSNYLFEVIKTINDCSSFTLALDIPSGIEADSGAILSEAIDADVTAAVCLPKVGYYLGSAPAYVGKIEVFQSGFPLQSVQGGDKFLLTDSKLSSLEEGRNKFAHKNTYGHTLVIAGSPGLTGAAVLASNGALRVGAGLVTAVTWKESYYELVARMPAEIMCGVIPTNDQEVVEVIRDLDKYDTVIIGPGLGVTEKSRDVVLKILNHFSGPVVVDADALKLIDLNKDKELLKQRKGLTVLTPHIGEFSGITGIDKTKVLEQPVTHLKEFVDNVNCAVVLKSSSSFIGFPNGEVFVNHFPNDGMATGGSGDVLAGILGGILAQFNGPVPSSGIFEDKSKLFEKICMGVGLHSLAGKIAAEHLGVMAMGAGDIVYSLGEAFSQIHGPSEDE
ncbi:MAG: NAD(P)H-hydrate dehydratase [Bacteriovoracaceae bacterium]